MASEPVEIVQGTGYSWTREFGEYDSSYTLTYELRGLTSTLTVTGTPSTSWSISITPTQSAALVSGPYVWQAFVSKGSDRFVVDSGSLIVTADLGASTTAESRTPARRRLAIYRAMLENVAYIKTLAPESIEALERVMKSLEWDVKREEDAEKLKRGGYPTRKIFTRFISPGA